MMRWGAVVGVVGAIACGKGSVSDRGVVDSGPAFAKRVELKHNHGFAARHVRQSIEGAGVGLVTPGGAAEPDGLVALSCREERCGDYDGLMGGAGKGTCITCTIAISPRGAATPMTSLTVFGRTPQMVTSGNLRQEALDDWARSDRLPLVGPCVSVILGEDEHVPTLMKHLDNPEIQAALSRYQPRTAKEAVTLGGPTANYGGCARFGAECVTALAEAFDETGHGDDALIDALVRIGGPEAASALGEQLRRRPGGESARDRVDADTVRAARAAQKRVKQRANQR